MMNRRARIFIIVIIACLVIAIVSIFSFVLLIRDNGPYTCGTPDMPSLVAQSSTRVTIPDDESDEAENLFYAYLSDGYRDGGSRNEKLYIDKNGKWSIAEISYGPVDEAIETIVKTGIVPKDQLKTFKDLVNRDAEKLRNDDELAILCEMPPQDLVRVSFTYQISSDDEVIFDDCWTGGNSDLELIKATNVLVAQIYVESGLKPF